MRLYLLLLLAPVLLASCNPDPDPGPRVDLVGSTRFLSSSRSSSVAADTFTTRVFADKRNDADPDLRRLLITVEYKPMRNPYVYPNVGFDYGSIPSDAPLVFLDSMLTGAQRQAVAFQFTANTRSTPGREIWRFKAENEDGQGEETQRSFTLRYRPTTADSLLPYHRYDMVLPAPTAPGSRSYLSLLPGLSLPSYSLRQIPDNRQLIDLVYLNLPDGGRALASPTDLLFKARTSFWTTERRQTQLRATALDSAGFLGVATQAGLEAAFAAGTPFGEVTHTDPLTIRGGRRVIAFRTADNKTGLIFIRALPTTPVAAISMQVRVTK